MPYCLTFNLYKHNEPVLAINVKIIYLLLSMDITKRVIFEKVKEEDNLINGFVVSFL